MTGLWFSPGPLVSSTNKTDRHDIIEILLKVALKTIKQQTSIKLNLPALLPTSQITDNSKFSAFMIFELPNNMLQLYLCAYTWF